MVQKVINLKQERNGLIYLKSEEEYMVSFGTKRLLKSCLNNLKYLQNICGSAILKTSTYIAKEENPLP